eukprot:SAG11_NODE_11716_length_742_cov_1.561431_1_plen_33_part_10
MYFYYGRILLNAPGFYVAHPARSDDAAGPDHME